VFIRLAFLALDIVQSIVAGRQPSDMTAEGLTRHIAIPIDGVRRKPRSIFDSTTPPCRRGFSGAHVMRNS
jgi:hypothetical protein